MKRRFIALPGLILLIVLCMFFFPLNRAYAGAEDELMEDRQKEVSLVDIGQGGKEKGGQEAEEASEAHLEEEPGIGPQNIPMRAPEEKGSPEEEGTPKEEKAPEKKETPEEKDARIKQEYDKEKAKFDNPNIISNVTDNNKIALIEEIKAMIKDLEAKEKDPAKKVTSKDYEDILKKLQELKLPRELSQEELDLQNDVKEADKKFSYVVADDQTPDNKEKGQELIDKYIKLKEDIAKLTDGHSDEPSKELDNKKHELSEITKKIEDAIKDGIIRRTYVDPKHDPKGLDVKIFNRNSYGVPDKQLVEKDDKGKKIYYLPENTQANLLVQVANDIKGDKSLTVTISPNNKGSAEVNMDQLMTSTIKLSNGTIIAFEKDKSGNYVAVIPEGQAYEGISEFLLTLPGLKGDLHDNFSISVKSEKDGVSYGKTLEFQVTKSDIDDKADIGGMGQHDDEKKTYPEIDGGKVNPDGTVTKNDPKEVQPVSLKLFELNKWIDEVLKNGKLSPADLEKLDVTIELPKDNGKVAKYLHKKGLAFEEHDGKIRLHLEYKKLKDIGADVEKYKELKDIGQDQACVFKNLIIEEDGKYLIIYDRKNDDGSSVTEQKEIYRYKFSLEEKDSKGKTVTNNYFFNGKEIYRGNIVDESKPELTTYEKVADIKNGRFEINGHNYYLKKEDDGSYKVYSYDQAYDVDDVIDEKVYNKKEKDSDGHEKEVADPYVRDVEGKIITVTEDGKKYFGGKIVEDKIFLNRDGVYTKDDKFVGKKLAAINENGEFVGSVTIPENAKFEEHDGKKYYEAGVIKYRVVENAVFKDGRLVGGYKYFENPAGEYFVLDRYGKPYDFTAKDNAGTWTFTSKSDDGDKTQVSGTTSGTTITVNNKDKTTVTPDNTYLSDDDKNNYVGVGPKAILDKKNKKYISIEEAKLVNDNYFLNWKELATVKDYFNKTDGAYKDYSVVSGKIGQDIKSTLAEYKVLENMDMCGGPLYVKIADGIYMKVKGDATDPQFITDNDQKKVTLLYEGQDQDRKIKAVYGEKILDLVKETYFALAFPGFNAGNEFIHTLKANVKAELKDRKAKDDQHSIFDQKGFDIVKKFTLKDKQEVDFGFEKGKSEELNKGKKMSFELFNLIYRSGEDRSRDKELFEKDEHDNLVMKKKYLDEYKQFFPLKEGEEPVLENGEFKIKYKDANGNDVYRDPVRILDWTLNFHGDSKVGYPTVDKSIIFDDNRLDSRLVYDSIEYNDRKAYEEANKEANKEENKDKPNPTDPTLFFGDEIESLYLGVNPTFNTNGFVPVYRIKRGSDGNFVIEYLLNSTESKSISQEDLVTIDKKTGKARFNLKGFFFTKTGDKYENMVQQSYIANLESYIDGLSNEAFKNLFGLEKTEENRASLKKAMTIPNLLGPVGSYDGRFNAIRVVLKNTTKIGGPLNGLKDKKLIVGSVLRNDVDIPYTDEFGQILTNRDYYLNKFFREAFLDDYYAAKEYGVNENSSDQAWVDAKAQLPEYKYREYLKKALDKLNKLVKSGKIEIKELVENDEDGNYRAIEGSSKKLDYKDLAGLTDKYGQDINPYYSSALSGKTAEELGKKDLINARLRLGEYYNHLQGKGMPTFDNYMAHKLADGRDKGKIFDKGGNGNDPKIVEGQTEPVISKADDYGKKDKPSDEVKKDNQESSKAQISLSETGSGDENPPGNKTDKKASKDELHIEEDENGKINKGGIDFDIRVSINEMSRDDFLNYEIDKINKEIRKKLEKPDNDKNPRDAITKAQKDLEFAREYLKAQERAEYLRKNNITDGIFDKFVEDNKKHYQDILKDFKEAENEANIKAYLEGLIKSAEDAYEKTLEFNAVKRSDIENSKYKISNDNLKTPNNVINLKDQDLKELNAELGKAQAKLKFYKKDGKDINYPIYEHSLIGDILPKDLEFSEEKDKETKITLEISDNSDMEEKEKKALIKEFKANTEIVRTDNLKAYYQGLFKAAKEDKKLQGKLKSLQVFMLTHPDFKDKDKSENLYGKSTDELNKKIVKIIDKFTDRKAILAFFPDFEAKKDTFKLSIKNLVPSDISRDGMRVNHSLFISEPWIGLAKDDFNITSFKGGQTDKYLRIYEKDEQGQLKKDKDGNPIPVKDPDEWFKGTARVDFNDIFDYKIVLKGSDTTDTSSLGGNVGNIIGDDSKVIFEDYLPNMDDGRGSQFRTVLRGKVQADPKFIVHYYKVKVGQDGKPLLDNDSKVQLEDVTANIEDKDFDWSQVVKLDFRIKNGEEFKASKGAEFILPMRVPDFKITFENGKIIYGNEYFSIEDLKKGPIKAINETDKWTSNPVKVVLDKDGVIKLIKIWKNRYGEEIEKENLKDQKAEFKIKRTTKVTDKVNDKQVGKPKETIDYPYDKIELNYDNDFQAVISGLKKEEVEIHYDADGKEMSRKVISYKYEIEEFVSGRWESRVLISQGKDKDGKVLDAMGMLTLVENKEKPYNPENPGGDEPKEPGNEEPKNPGEEEPGKPEEPDKPENPDKPSKPENPSTGDLSIIGNMAVIFVALSALYLLGIKKKKVEE